MFSKDYTICKIPERRTVTPLRYKKFLCYSLCMYGGFRNSEFLRRISHSTSVFYYVIRKFNCPFFNITSHIQCLPFRNQIAVFGSLYAILMIYSTVSPLL